MAEGTQGWLTKCHRSERNWGAQSHATCTPTIITPPHLYKKEKKTLPHCGRFCFLWEQLYRRSSYLSRSVEKLGRVFENVTEKLLIVPFVCPFLTFIFHHWLPVWQEYGNIIMFTSAAVTVRGGSSGRRLVLDGKIEICLSRFFWIPKLPHLHRFLCVGLPANVSVSMYVFLFG